MQFAPALLPSLIQAIDKTIETNAEEVTALDQAIGDGDHVTNLQRGIKALIAQSDELATLDWVAAWQKIGMTMMTAVGGASGSLYGTLFVAMSKAARERPLDLQVFAEIFTSGVDAVKQRGKADAGEKTMLDVLIPVAASLRQAAADSVALPVALEMSRGQQSRVWSLPGTCWRLRGALLFWRSAAGGISMRALKPVS
jgi:DAK2 domain.